MSHQEILSTLSEKSPYEFEEFVSELWERQGWDTKVTSGSSDRGIDIVAERDTPFEQQQMLQVKRYDPDLSIGSNTVRQYATLYQQEEVDVVAIVTTASFTSEAEDLATDLNVKLIGGKDLIDLIHELDALDLIENEETGKPREMNSADKDVVSLPEHPTQLNLVTEERQSKNFEDISEDVAITVSSRNNVEKVLKSFRELHYLVDDLPPGILMDFTISDPEVQAMDAYIFTSTNTHQLNWLGERDSPQLKPLFEIPQLELIDVTKIDHEIEGVYQYTFASNVYEDMPGVGFDIERELSTIETMFEIGFGKRLDDIEYIRTPIPIEGSYSKSDLHEDIGGTIYYDSDDVSISSVSGFAGSAINDLLTNVGSHIQIFSSSVEKIAKRTSTLYLLAQTHLPLGPFEARIQGAKEYIKFRQEIQPCMDHLDWVIQKRKEVNPETIPYYKAERYRENTRRLHELQHELESLINNFDNIVDNHIIKRRVQEFIDDDTGLTNADVLKLTDTDPKKLEAALEEFTSNTHFETIKEISREVETERPK